MKSPNDFDGFGGLSASWPMGTAKALLSVYGVDGRVKPDFWGFMESASEFASLNKSFSLQFGSKNVLGNGPAFAGIGRGSPFSTSYLGWTFGHDIGTADSPGIKGDVVRAIKDIDDFTAAGLANAFRRLESVMQ